jgi:hypothetical protein
LVRSAKTTCSFSVSAPDQNKMRSRLLYRVRSSALVLLKLPEEQNSGLLDATPGANLTPALFTWVQRSQYSPEVRPGAQMRKHTPPEAANTHEWQLWIA